MGSPLAFYRWTELDRTTWPAFRDAAGGFETPGELHPRTHAGAPRVALPKVRARRLVSLDRTLAARRSTTRLSAAPLADRALAQILRFSHGALDTRGRGPTPSAGGVSRRYVDVATMTQPICSGSIPLASIALRPASMDLSLIHI